MTSFSSFEEIHDAACRNNQHSYIDPKTGYMVFTELAHKERGKCCGSGCRHCPYEFENLKESHPLMKPIWLNRRHTPHDTMSCSSSGSGGNSNDSSSSHRETKKMKVLFWSGGKDSFLTSRALLRNDLPDNICLLTTFDARLNIVANQELSIESIRYYVNKLISTSQQFDLLKS